MKIKRRFFSIPHLTCASCIALLCSIPFPSLAGSADTSLFYAGFAFAGDYNHREVLYPRTAALAKEQNEQLIDRLLRDKIQANPELTKHLSMEQDNGKNDTSTVAFALTGENAETQKIDGKYWSIVTLQADVLAFNTASHSLVAAYPLRLRSTEVKDHPPTETDIKEQVREAFTSTNPDNNILDMWLKLVRSATLHQGARKYLRVTSVVVTPEAERVIMASGKKVNAFKNQVANLLESSLSEKTGVPLVPNSVGEAIGSKMMLRFSNAKAVQLSLPEADYAITFTVRDFVSKKIEQPATYQNIFRSKAALAIRMPDNGHTYLDENIYDTQFVTLPKKAAIELNDWDQYYKSLQSLISGLGSQLVKVDSDWLEEHASRGKEARDGFVQAQKLVQELK